MPLVLQNSTITGNTAVGQESNNLMDFTKVMLRQDVDPTQTHSDPASSGGAGRDVLVGGRGADNIDAAAGKAEFEEFTIVKTIDGTLPDGDDYFSRTSEPADNSSGYEGTHILYQDVVVPTASEPKPYLQHKLDPVFVKSWSGSAEQDAFDFKAMDTSAAASSYAGALVVDPVDPAADSGTTAHTFTITISNTTSDDAFDFEAIDGGAARSCGGAAGGIVSEGQGYGLFIAAATAVKSPDTFDFKAMEESEAAGTQLSKVKVYICPSDGVSLNDDGMTDLATYQPDTDGGSLLGDIGVVGVPATLAEYGLLLA